MAVDLPYCRPPMRSANRFWIYDSLIIEPPAPDAWPRPIRGPDNNGVSRRGQGDVNPRNTTKAARVPLAVLQGAMVSAAPIGNTQLTFAGVGSLPSIRRGDDGFLVLECAWSKMARSQRLCHNKLSPIEDASLGLHK